MRIGMLLFQHDQLRKGNLYKNHECKLMNEKP